MKLTHKLVLTAILGSSALIALFLFKSFTQDYFNKRNSLELNFKKIETAHRQLDNQILNNAFFLYTNQDTVNTAIEHVYHSIDTVLSEPHIQESHPKTSALLVEHRRLFDEKVQTIYDFQTANIVIKNTTAGLLRAELDLFEETKFATPTDLAAMEAIHQTAGSILLAKNALDHELVRSLDSQIQILSQHRFAPSIDSEKLKRVFAHFKTIQEFFPRYVNTLERSQQPTVLATLKSSEKEFLRESDQELRVVSYFSYLLVLLFIISIAIIALFLIQAEREIRTDSLTRLRNRKAYEERIKHSSKELGLILINIRKFKHYNDFYGVAEGDRLLIETARHLQSLLFEGSKPTYYRLGADDFGILFELSPTQTIDSLAKGVLSAFLKKPMIIEGEIRTPSIRVAASVFKPLLETADMALKSNLRINPLIYHEGLNLRQVIEDNVTKVDELKQALNEKRLVPYFQPIIDLSTSSVTKHEVLARIMTKNGEIRSIYPYLSIAKESNLYPQITHTIITQSFALIANHKGDFSLNISIEDINNIETVEMIEQMLQRYTNIGKRIIFEILESEAIEEYANIVDFITKVRRYGCRIAIDDFGSGYSNFARILNLAIDIIKIDGSLIRNLDTDEKAITIVQTIVNFTKNSAIETVAEFVHNEAIANIVKELGVDGAQGFYFYEPAAYPVFVE